MVRGRDLGHLSVVAFVTPMCTLLCAASRMMGKARMACQRPLQPHQASPLAPVGSGIALVCASLHMGRPLSGWFDRVSRVLRRAR